MNEVELDKLFPLNINSMRRIRKSEDVQKIIKKLSEGNPRCKAEVICEDDFGEPVYIVEVSENSEAKDIIRILYTLHGCETNPYMNVVTPLVALDVIYHYATTEDDLDKEILKKYKLRFCFLSPSGFDLRARQMERDDGEPFYWIMGARNWPYGDTFMEDINSWLAELRNPRNVRELKENTSKGRERFAIDLHETQAMKNEAIEMMVDHPLLRGIVSLETYASQEDEKIGKGIVEELKGKHLLQSWKELWWKLIYLVGIESMLYERSYLKKELKPKGDGRSEEGELIKKGTSIYNVFANKKFGIPAITFEGCGRPYVSDSEVFSALRDATIVAIRKFYQEKGHSSH